MYLFRKKKIELSMILIVAIVLFASNSLAISPLKSSALNAINNTQRSLNSASIETDTHIYTGGTFTLAGCAMGFIPAPFKNADKFAKIGWDIEKKVLQKTYEDPAGAYLEAKIIGKFVDAINSDTSSFFYNATKKIESVNDANLINLQNTEFAEDIYRTQRLAVLESSNWPNQIKQLNDAYDNNQLVKTVIMFGASILAIYTGGSSIVAEFVISYGLATSDCAIDAYSYNTHAGLISRLTSEDAGNALRYTDKITEGISYLSTVQNEADLPKIELDIDTSTPLQLPYIKNKGNVNANIDIIYNANYHTDAGLIFSKIRNYQGNESYTLSPNKKITLMLKEDEVTKDWINSLPYSCLESQLPTGVMVYSNYTLNVFYGAGETVALKQKFIEQFPQHFACKRKCDTSSFKGVCKNANGSQTYMGNGLWSACTTDYPYPKKYEIVELNYTDSLDNDCDGITDELSGDVNKDCLVDIMDLFAIGINYKITSSDPKWVPNANVYPVWPSENIIDMFDFNVVGKQFGATKPNC